MTATSLSVDCADPLAGPIAALFAEAGVTGCLHALDLATGAEVAHHADDPVVPASVFKLPVLVELCRQGAVGELDTTVAVPMPVEDRTPGPTGISVMQDPLTVSLRDLATLMMSVSDNAATDVICAVVGLDKVNATVRALGLEHTAIEGDCAALFATMLADSGLASVEDLVDVDVDEQLLARLRALDPVRSLQRTTARDVTRLLRLVWDDEAAPPEACAEVRRVLGLQVWPHRLASGFPEDEVRTSGKTGTLPRVRNEVGVVEYPDGGRYAVACFTTAAHYTVKNVVQDAVIGRAARAAVDALRGA